MVYYRLSYFPVRFRAETARQIFAVAGVPYDDNRINPADWPEYKEKTPFGSIPLLEVNGDKIPESDAINRYLARQFGLAGKTPVEEAQVDSLVELFKDYAAPIPILVQTILGMLPGNKDKIYSEKVIPARDQFLPFIKNILVKSRSGYLVGDGLTYVDLLITEHFTSMLSHFPDFTEGCPEITRYIDRVRSNPRLKKWIETRPASPF